MRRDYLLEKKPRYRCMSFNELMEKHGGTQMPSQSMHSMDVEVPLMEISVYNLKHTTVIYSGNPMFEEFFVGGDSDKDLSKIENILMEGIPELKKGGMREKFEREEKERLH